jgi:hypothetical protein
VIPRSRVWAGATQLFNLHDARSTEESSHQIAFILVIVAIVINLVLVFAASVFLFVIFFIRLFSMPDVDC